MNVFINRFESHSHNPEKFVPGSLDVHKRVCMIYNALAKDPKYKLKEDHLVNEQSLLEIRSWTEKVHDKKYIQYLQDTSDYLEKIFQEQDKAESIIPFSFPIRSYFSSKPKTIQGLSGYYLFDTFTPILYSTYKSSLMSAQLALSAARDLVENNENNENNENRKNVAYAVCRPPGHHASVDIGGGYCYLNNAAIAAKYLVEETKKNVLIVDVDYHAGNGTQEICKRNLGMSYLSLHADPDYEEPFFCERYSLIDNTTCKHVINVPLTKDIKEKKNYLQRLDKALKEVPFPYDYLVVSLGTDICEDDPYNKIGGLSVDDFSLLGVLLKGCDKPTLFIQEGGYHLQTMGTCVKNVLDGFLDG